MSDIGRLRPVDRDRASASIQQSHAIWSRRRLPQTLNRADDGEAIADAHVVAPLDVAERTSNP
jgi:hypothetical protein